MNPEFAILFPAAVTSWLLTLLILRYVSVMLTARLANELAERLCRAGATIRGNGAKIR
jgi:hypothetical protein